MYGSVVAALTLIAQGCIAQTALPGLLPLCPTAPEHGCLRALCHQYLPLGDLMLLHDSPNGYCIMRCPGVDTLRFSSAHQLRQLLFQQYRNNFDIYVPARQDCHYDEPCNAPRLWIDLTSAEPVLSSSGQTPCQADERAARIFITMKRELSGFLPRTQVIFESQDCEKAFPTYIPASPGSSDDYHLIQVPWRFLMDATVGVELMEFMFLHEIAHGALNTDNEIEADNWAARIGLPLYHGDTWTLDLGISRLEAITRQLEGYMTSQFGRQNAQLASGGCSLGTYPELRCRLAVIRGEYTCANDLPSDCYEPVMASNTTVLPRTDTRIQPCVGKSPCEERCLHLAQLGSFCFDSCSPGVANIRIKDACTRFPRLCGLQHVIGHDTLLQLRPPSGKDWSALDERLMSALRKVDKAIKKRPVHTIPEQP